MKLLEIQRRMAADIMRPLDSRAKATGKAKVASYLTPNDRLTAPERLEIYHHSYWYRILDSLYEDFPGLRSIIGDAAFHRLSLAYLSAHPSRSFTMRDLGQDLASWLLRRRQYTGSRHALALDMVRLEWAHIEAFDSPAVKPLEPEDLLELGAKMRMGIQPHLRLLELHHAVDELRISVSRNDNPHATASNAVTQQRHRAIKRRTVPREKSVLYVAVHRFDDTVYYRRIEREAFGILTSLGGGDPIDTALKHGFAGSSLDADQYQAEVSRWFAIFAELGWLCRPPSR